MLGEDDTEEDDKDAEEHRGKPKDLDTNQEAIKTFVLEIHKCLEEPKKTDFRDANAMVTRVELAMKALKERQSRKRGKVHGNGDKQSKGQEKSTSSSRPLQAKAEKGTGQKGQERSESSLHPVQAPAGNGKGKGAQVDNEEQARGPLPDKAKKAEEGWQTTGTRAKGRWKREKPDVMTLWRKEEIVDYQHVGVRIPTGEVDPGSIRAASG